MVAWVLLLSILPRHLEHEPMHRAPATELVKAPPHQFKMMRPVTFAAVGDSISARAEQGARFAWQSWTYGAESSTAVYVPGGYAVPGRTTVDMLAGAVPLDVDVLVFQGAVNDVNLHYPHPDILDRIAQIVAIADTPHALVSALPPNDRYPAEALTFNAELAAYSAAHGWTFVDPWTAWRNPDGTYVAGGAWDDLHPVAATADSAGATLGDALWAIANHQKVLAA
jgi:acyl-CoA thioesterase I